MAPSDILNQVDGARIYEHVLKLHGIKHPIDAPRELGEAADYLHSEFERYSLALREQTFGVAGFEGTFRNVEGALKRGDNAELLVVAHYDTVENSPGADDNASGVAVMLEAARVLALQEIGNVRFIGFTLEELNPAFALRSRQLAQSLGLKDSQNRYTSLHVHTNMKKLFELQRKYWTMGKGPADALAAARTEIEALMDEAEIAYAKRLEEMYKGITSTSWPGKTGTMGSSVWVEEAIRANRNIMGVLCFDTIGYTSDKEHSQTLPPGMKPEMLQTGKSTSSTIGNFIGVVGDINSGKLIQSFYAQSQFASIGLSCAALQVPLHYEQIASGMGDLLRSDHAPFWRQGIPALFITDTADFRYAYYHTPADTIDKLDFSLMTKICKATIATALNLTSR
jgi:hypothetical protein